MGILLFYEERILFLIPKVSQRIQPISKLRTLYRLFS